MLNEGEVYLFHKEDMFDRDTRRILKNVSGIYVVKDINEKVLYVGKSINLYSRLNLKAHHSIRKYLDEVHTISIVPIEERAYQVKMIINSKPFVFDRSRLDTAEYKLIKKYNPKYNIVDTPKHSKMMEDRFCKKWIILKDDKPIYKVESSYHLERLFTNGDVWLNKTLNRVTSSHLQRLKKGEVICGISVIEEKKYLEKNRGAESEQMSA